MNLESPPPVSDAPAPALPRVLVVDDSRMVRASIIKHIRASYEFREEGDGESGWQTLLLDPAVQVVISDLSMPKLDGYGLLERIRASKIARIREIPVIMISGDEDDDARARAKALGATDFITKGIGTVELLTRLESSIKAAQLRRELDESRDAMQRQKPVDPRLGLVTREYLYSHGAQLLALARHQLGDVSVMVIDVDRFAELSARHGPQVAGLVVRKLSKILGARVRKEDNVAHFDAARFCIVSPSVNVDAYAAFALRLRAAIESIALGYRGEVIRISLTIGLANSRDDVVDTIDEMIALATERVVQAAFAGGNRVVDGGGEVQRSVADVAMSVDRALVLLQSRSLDLVRQHSAGLGQRLLPLLEFLENEYHLGIPLAAMEQQFGGADQKKRETTN